MAGTDKNGLEIVSGRGVARIEIDGVEDSELLKLLEAAADAIRNNEEKIRAESTDEDGLEALFQNVDLGTFVVLSHRS